AFPDWRCSATVARALSASAALRYWTTSSRLRRSQPTGILLSVSCPCIVRGGLKGLFEFLHRPAKIEEDFLVHRRDAWISAWVLSQVNGIRGTHATLATPRTSR